MERPVYHIPGAVREKQEARDFVGPLDLILHLLRKDKIAIRDIPLAEILRQYLDWMSARERLDLEVAGEFIAMASQLMYLKTRMLLAEEDQEALSEMEAPGEFYPAAGGPAPAGGAERPGQFYQGPRGKVPAAGVPLRA